jgi:[acyl-carrier-protein] S-malonyltransferase
MPLNASASLGLVFPGQGSQHVGMLAELAAQSALVQETFAEASAVLGYDLWTLVEHGPAEQLGLTAVTQPAILTASVALWRLWCARGGQPPALMAGHSLGEYSALVCAGAVDFRAAVGLVRRRGELMQDAVPVGVGAMAAVLGLDDAVIDACCMRAAEAGVVRPANFNSPGQVVISGHSAAVERAMALCKEAGAKRTLLLQVSAPFHSPLMEPAAREFAAVIADVVLQAPRIAVVQNVGLDPVFDPEQIRQRLVAQIASPVPWVATMQYFADRGVQRLLEFGPGKVLAGLNKRIDGRLDTLAVNDPASIEQALLAAVGQS